MSERSHHSWLYHVLRRSFVGKWYRRHDRLGLTPMGFSAGDALGWGAIFMAVFAIAATIVVAVVGGAFLYVAALFGWIAAVLLSWLSLAVD